MERKIGEVFIYNDKLYQVVEVLNVMAALL